MRKRTKTAAGLGAKGAASDAEFFDLMKRIGVKRMRAIVMRHLAEQQAEEADRLRRSVGRIGLRRARAIVDSILDDRSKGVRSLA